MITIDIHQTLHGYQNGHQLLASSIDLSLPIKKTILFQSDLSGSNISENFESYISGYPIKESNLYAFSKTWYANEMKRPGCVWTHTLLINISDLGKLAEFKTLNELFRRPTVDQYLGYNTPIVLDSKGLLSGSIMSNYENAENQGKWILSSVLYDNPRKTIIIPSESSHHYEECVLEIWSDQWPRLRRNFTFCTGALSLKTLANREFDLQIVPIGNIPFVDRQSKNLFVLSSLIDRSEWTYILQKYRKNELRKFLWSYGSDVEGVRQNFVPLLELFDLVSMSDCNLERIGEKFERYFPLITEAKFLKSKIFGVDSIIQNKCSEKEILNFLLTADINFISIEDFRIAERLASIYRNQEITLAELFELINGAQEGRLNFDELLELIELKDANLFAYLEGKKALTEIIISKRPSLALNQNIWQLSDSIQSIVLHSLLKDKRLENIKPYVGYILESHSKIIFEVYKSIGEDSIYWTLDWLNSSNHLNVSNEWWTYISKSHQPILFRWLKNAIKVNEYLYLLIITSLSAREILQLNLTSSELDSVYRRFRNTSTDQFVKIACVVLSVGLSDKTKDSEKIVALSFHDVFNFASKSLLTNEYWQLIPKQIEYLEDIDNSFDWFGLSSKKKPNTIRANDYPEILIRTIANKFIANSWSNQCFLSTLTGEEELKRVIKYYLHFDVGKYFLNRLSMEIQSGKVKYGQYQKTILKKFVKIR